MPYKEFEPKDSLEACLTKLWGDPRVVNPKTRLEEIILKIADAQPSGQTIPAPANPSDGDVLTYDSTEGEWVAVAPSGDVLVCTLSPIPDDPNENEILNKTWNELYEASSAGKMIIIKAEYTGDDPGDVDSVTFFVFHVLNSESRPFSIAAALGSEDVYFSAASANGYPQTHYESQ